MTQLASIPSGWRQRRLRFDIKSNPKKAELDLDPETEVSFVPMDAVGEFGGLRLDTTRAIADVFKDYTYFTDGDVCVARITPCFENGKGALADGLTEGVAFGTTELHVLRPLGGVDRKFLFYITISHDFRGWGEAEMLGAGGQKRVPERFIKDWRAPLPDLDTQRRIAGYLDDKTARIDALIEKKRALLDRLAEKRQALITRAVTRGLNPVAPLKDSGIDWLGKVPAHWEVKPVKRVAKLQSGHTPDKQHDEYWNGEIPWVSLNDTAAIRSGDYIDETAFSITPEGIANSSARLLPARAVVFTRDATIGEAAITTRPMAVSQHIIAWLCPEDLLAPEFLLFVIYGMRGELMRITNGTTIGTIGMADVKAIRIALPPLDEQTAIVAHVIDKKAQVENAILRVETSIEKLTEYRAALVTAAVTGKIKALLTASTPAALMEEA